MYCGLCGKPRADAATDLGRERLLPLAPRPLRSLRRRGLYLELAIGASSGARGLGLLELGHHLLVDACVQA